MSVRKPVYSSAQHAGGSPMSPSLDDGRSSKIYFILFLGLVLLLAPALSVFGQATEGTILGTVRDETGAVLPGVTVKVTNLGTNISRTVTTDDWGNYRIPNLLIGSYQVEGERAGFKRVIVTSVRLSIGENVRVDLTLKVGEITGEVNVSSGIDIIRTDSAELAYQIRERELLELPLNGRVYLNLAHQLPGATAGLNDRRRERDGATITVGGGRAEANNYIIDGVSNVEERTGGFIIAPSVEAIQEFKVQSSQYSAEYGKAGGGVINVSIKSGTNDFHGSIFEFHRNSALDARNFFDPEPLPFIRNQFGGAVGGPIWRNHTFFFFNYEGTRIRQNTTRFGNVPEPEWINGDFSRAPFRIYDPATARPDPNNPNRIIRDPFPGNIIPQDRIDTIARRIVSFYARPNYSQPGSSFNFISTNSLPRDENQYNIRIDHQIGQADQLSGRLSYNNIEQFDAGLGAFPQIDGTEFLNKGVQISLSETHIFGPNILNEVRLGYGYNDLKASRPESGQAVASGLGIPGLSIRAPFPLLDVRNLAGPDRPGSFGLGGDSEDRFEVFQLIDTVSLKARKHGLKFGADIQRIHYSRGSESEALGSGRFSFDGRYTSAVGGQRTQVGLADLLLGLPSGTNLTRGFDQGRYRYWNHQFFIQDDWQISSHVTLNLGLRYELQTPAREIRGRESSVDLRTGEVRIQKRAIPILENIVGINLNQLPFPVRVEDTDHFYRADKNNFAPRFGLAWRPFGNNYTAIRLGAGTFYVAGLANITASHFFNPPFRFSQAQTGDLIRPNLSLSSGFPTVAADALRLPTFQNLTTDDWEIGYYNKWSLSIQHQLTSDMMFETTYLGHTAPKQYVNFRANRPQPGPGGVQARRQYPLLGAISQFDHLGTSTYHGWLNQVRVSNWNGLTLQASYTFSKAIDNQSAFGGAGDGKAGLVPYPDNIRADKARASFDATHRFTTSFIYTMPRLQSTGPLVSNLLGHWQISALVTLQTGFPFQVNLADDVANVGDTSSFRPNRLCDGNLPVSQRTPERWFDTSCFAVPAQFTFGNAGRNILEQDGIKNVDFALMKNIPLSMIGESHYLQFRAEFFNVFNNVNFGLPGSTVARTGYGIVTSTAANARQIQFGLKYVF